MKVHIIYLQEAMIVSKELFSKGWKEIQDKYPSYKTSLGPWEQEELIQYLRKEYPEDCADMEIKLLEFFLGEKKTIDL